MIILFLLLVSFVPVGIALLWFWVRKLTMPPPYFLLFIAGGILSLVLAAFIQGLIPEGGNDYKWQILFDIFVRVALVEEGARLAVFMALFALPYVFSKKITMFEGFAAAGGLIGGLVFAALETAAHAAAGSNIVIVRALTAAPLHGACGIRCGTAAYNINKAPLPAVSRFLSAVALHGFYNFMLPRGGLSAMLAVLLAVTALASSALAIKNQSD